MRTKLNPIQTGGGLPERGQVVDNKLAEAQEDRGDVGGAGPHQSGPRGGAGQEG